MVFITLKSVKTPRGIERQVLIQKQGQPTEVFAGTPKAIHERLCEVYNDEYPDAIDLVTGTVRADVAAELAKKRGAAK